MIRRPVLRGRRLLPAPIRDHGWTINGRTYEPGRPLAEPKLGTTEVWRFISDFHHPVHVHLDPLQVLGRNNRPPGHYDAGWKDTVDVRPAEAADVAVRFTDHAGTFHAALPQPRARGRGDDGGLHHGLRGSAQVPENSRILSAGLLM
jgi:FtsP/CotA-like multicopper oxidase with cupredoxin domain